MDDYRSRVRSAVSSRAAVARRARRCWRASTNSPRTCRIASACRRSWRATARPPCARSPSPNGWARARSTPGACSARCASAAPTSRRSSKGCSSTSAHRTASSISASASTTTAAASSGCRTAARSWTSSRWARSSSSACAITSRIRLSTPQRWRPIRAPACARSIGRRACRPTAQPHCHWRVRIEPDADAAGGDRAHRPRAPVAAGATRAAGAHRPPRERARRAAPTTPARSIPISISRTSRSRPRPQIAQEFCLQGHLLVRSFMTAIAERWGETSAREIAAQQFIGSAGLAAERVAAAMRIRHDRGPAQRIRRRRPRCDREALPDPPGLLPARLCRLPGRTQE